MSMTRLLRISALLTILGLIFMVWSILQPTPLPVMLAMSVGQAIGTAAFGLYGYVILVDLRRERRRKRRDSMEHIAQIKEHDRESRDDIEQTKDDIAQSKDDIAQSKDDIAQSKDDIAQSKDDIVQSKDDPAP